jgi:hypothetical protein
LFGCGDVQFLIRWDFNFVKISCNKKLNVHSIAITFTHFPWSYQLRGALNELLIHLTVNSQLKGKRSRVRARNEFFVVRLGEVEESHLIPKTALLSFFSFISILSGENFKIVCLLLHFIAVHTLIHTVSLLLPSRK